MCFQISINRYWKSQTSCEDRATVAHRSHKPKGVPGAIPGLATTNQMIHDSKTLGSSWYLKRENATRNLVVLLNALSVTKPHISHNQLHTFLHYRAKVESRNEQ